MCTSQRENRFVLCRVTLIGGGGSSLALVQAARLARKTKTSVVPIGREASVLRSVGAWCGVQRQRGHAGAAQAPKMRVAAYCTCAELQTHELLVALADTRNKFSLDEHVPEGLSVDPSTGRLLRWQQRMFSNVRCPERIACHHYVVPRWHTCIFGCPPRVTATRRIFFVSRSDASYSGVCWCEFW